MPRAWFRCVRPPGWFSIKVNGHLKSFRKSRPSFRLLPYFLRIYRSSGFLQYHCSKNGFSNNQEAVFAPESRAGLCMLCITSISYLLALITSYILMHCVPFRRSEFYWCS
ncbi:hypothetical protein PVAG01_09454 [Phlyctema vagabunda]|uniref:Uncharacterized protein n=1 Tax=Phlyctema vagabunda TaxID=108571 RepID=A0ABR4P7K1_9HELO